VQRDGEAIGVLELGTHEKFFNIARKTARATGVVVRNPGRLLATMAWLGMPPYGWQTQDGYKNTEGARSV